MKRSPAPLRQFGSGSIGRPVSITVTSECFLQKAKIAGICCGRFQIGTEASAANRDQQPHMTTR